MVSVKGGERWIDEVEEEVVHAIDTVCRSLAFIFA